MAKFIIKSPAKGVLMGVSMTGGWLLADLLLPEPWGDFVLFGAMAVVNVGVGWTLGRLFDSQNDKGTTETIESNNTTNLEVRS